MPSLISGIKVLNMLYNYKASIDLISSEFIEGRKVIKDTQEIIINSANEFEVKNISFKYQFRRNYKRFVI